MKNREWLRNMAMIDKLLIIAKNCHCPIIVLTAKGNAMLIHKRCKARRANGSCINCLADWLNEEATQ